MKNFEVAFFKFASCFLIQSNISIPHAGYHLSRCTTNTSWECFCHACSHLRLKLFLHHVRNAQLCFVRSRATVQVNYSTVTVRFPHEFDLVIVAVHLEPRIILKIKNSRSYRYSSNSFNIRGFIKYWIPTGETSRRGISSNGRARALHVRGSGIDARILHQLPLS